MRIDNVKRAMHYQTIYHHNGGEYFITACTIRIRDGAWYYQLELCDAKQKNSVLIVNMEEFNDDNE